MIRCAASAVVRQSLLITVFSLASVTTYAACQSEMRILGDDLAGVKLTSQQSQYIADKILKARRHCWVHHEQEAMELINSARRIAGLKETTGEFDWENVPLESLQVED